MYAKQAAEKLAQSIRLNERGDNDASQNMAMMAGIMAMVSVAELFPVLNEILSAMQQTLDSIEHDMEGLSSAVQLIENRFTGH